MSAKNIDYVYPENSIFVSYAFWLNIVTQKLCNKRANNYVDDIMTPVTPFCVHDRICCSKMCPKTWNPSKIL